MMFGNLVLDQLIIPFFIIITCLLILWGEILFWSLMGVKGLVLAVKLATVRNSIIVMGRHLQGNVLWLKEISSFFIL